MWQKRVNNINQPNASTVMTSTYTTKSFRTTTSTSLPPDVILEKTKNDVKMYINNKEYSMSKILEIIDILTEMHQEEIDIYKIADSICMVEEDE